MRRFRIQLQKTARRARSSLQANGEEEWTLAGGWRMTPAPKVNADGAAISQPDYSARDWWPATVPGTVLTTMIDRGVYPDPDYGMNNLAIPESLNKQDYWYRVEFRAPKDDACDGGLTLTFEGINYEAAVWLNGNPSGSIKGAFIRGVFDVTGVVKPSNNVLAVRVSPPPHPGIPQEQSIKGGPGENGGLMCLDGPTFVATEGWDWIPAIRDRDTGIWQPVTLTATSDVKIGDAQVVTTLPLPDTSRADVEITVPLENLSNSPISGTLKASFGDIVVTQADHLAPGKTFRETGRFRIPAIDGAASAAVVAERLRQAGAVYVEAELSRKGASIPTAKQLRFGIREITYELSLLDSCGHLRRVEYSPTAAREKGEQVVDVRHEGIREIPRRRSVPGQFPPEWKEGWKSWVYSLMPGGESSPSVRMLDDTRRCALSGDQSEWRAHRLPGRELGHGRFAQARFARKTRTVFSPAPRREPEHHSQLGRAEHRRSFLRSRR